MFVHNRKLTENYRNLRLCVLTLVVVTQQQHSSSKTTTTERVAKNECDFQINRHFKYFCNGLNKFVVLHVTTLIFNNRTIQRETTSQSQRSTAYQAKD